MRRPTVVVLLFTGLVAILAGMLMPSGMREPRYGHRHQVKENHRAVQVCLAPLRPAQSGPCVGAPVCSGNGDKVRIIDLIRDGNRYDRRLVMVTGEAIMLKHRRSHCGDYLYFVLKDDAGYHVNVTDYTMSRRLLEERRVTVLGYYRAHIHEIQVCLEVKP